MTTERPDWDDYYLGIAKAVAARGECVRRRVGAVVVQGHAIVSTGYNGAPAGQPSCLDGACPRAQSNATPGVGYAQSGCVVIHAEANALLRAGRDRTLGATIYITDEPCELCAPLIEAAGITRVVTPKEPGVPGACREQATYPWRASCEACGRGSLFYADSESNARVEAEVEGWVFQPDLCPDCI